MIFFDEDQTTFLMLLERFGDLRVEDSLHSEESEVRCPKSSDALFKGQDVVSYLFVVNRSTDWVLQFLPKRA